MLISNLNDMVALRNQQNATYENTRKYTNATKAHKKQINQKETTH